MLLTCATGTLTTTWPCRSEARPLTTDTATGTQLPAGTWTPYVSEMRSVTPDELALPAQLPRPKAGAFR